MTFYKLRGAVATLNYFSPDILWHFCLLCNWSKALSRYLRNVSTDEISYPHAAYSEARHFSYRSRDYFHVPCYTFSTLGNFFLISASFKMETYGGFSYRCAILPRIIATTSIRENGELKQRERAKIIHLITNTESWHHNFVIRNKFRRQHASYEWEANTYVHYSYILGVLFRLWSYVFARTYFIACVKRKSRQRRER